MGDYEKGLDRGYDNGYKDAMDLYFDKVSPLEDEIKRLRYENEQLRETVTNQEIVIRCHQEACQGLDNISV